MRSYSFGNFKKKIGYEEEKSIIDQIFYRDYQNKFGTKSIKDDSIPSSLDDKYIILIDVVIYTWKTSRSAMEALNFWRWPKIKASYNDWYRS